jgi:hypothetical protein
MGQVYAAAQGNAGWVCIHNFGQKSAEFGPTHENVIGPFQEKPGFGQKARNQFMHRNCCYKAYLGRGRRRGCRLKQAGDIEVSRL